ncbi:hypothetical protein [Paenarthrobacter sp. 2TAF44]|uniref:hypothetical protein n=1 Tax=Paenarthrobacter sp. 2TAF44 TaxID=3233018 RepID=UPI003F95EBDD
MYTHRKEQDSSSLETNQLVGVEEHGRPKYPATIDAKTEDSTVLSILPHGDHHRAIHSVDGAVLDPQPTHAQP